MKVYAQKRQRVAHGIEEIVLLAGARLGNHSQAIHSNRKFRIVKIECNMQRDQEVNAFYLPELYRAEVLGC